MFADGNTSGTLQDVSIGPDGMIMARYSNGEMRPLGQIPVAQFLNPEGLERIGNNLWITSANSGEFDGIGGHGEIMPGALEMSNVEMSGEFTEMITTQRGFQANSRVITTSDEMLQELVNLKR
jgi:flagellar hook protein FlgE